MDATVIMVRAVNGLLLLSGHSQRGGVAKPRSPAVKGTLEINTRGLRTCLDGDLTFNGLLYGKRRV